MYQRLIGLLNIVVCFILFKSTRGETKSACFGRGQKSVDIVCPSGSMVRINKAFYGYSHTNSCMYTPGDCVLSEKENFQCIGHKKCSINLPSGHFGRKITACGKYSNYFQVEYQCHKDETTKDICQTAKFTGQRGFISTPRYPNNYHGPAVCETNIEVNDNQKIDLYIIDMDIQRNGSAGCVDWMYVYDNFRSITLCGQRGNETFTSMRNHVQIKFNSDHTGHQKGFWLYYEAFPPLDEPEPDVVEEQRTETIKKNKTLLSEILTPDNAKNKKDSDLKTIPVKHYYHRKTPEDDTDFPFAAIVAGVIGTLVLILTILLILLLYMWYKDKKRRNSKQTFLEIRNPAYRSSGLEFSNCEYYEARRQESFYC